MAEQRMPTDEFIANLPFLFWLSGGEGLEISHWSEATARQLGYGDSRPNMPLADLIGDEAANNAAVWLHNSDAASASYRFDGRLRRKDGTFLYAAVQWGRMNFSGQTMLVCSGILPPQPNEPDGTKISTVAEYSRQDALRIVAEGMGHEVNNPLQAIFGYTELARILNKDPALTPHLREIMQSAERVKAAVASLKNFTFPDIQS